MRSRVALDQLGYAIRHAFKGTWLLVMTPILGSVVPVACAAWLKW